MVCPTGQCADPRMKAITMKECCCSMGAGWGRGCQDCPIPGSGTVCHNNPAHLRLVRPFPATQFPRGRAHPTFILYTLPNYTAVLGEAVNV